MIDSRSFISLVRASLASDQKLNAAPRDLQLVSAAGEPIPILGQITLPIQLGGLEVRRSPFCCNSVTNYSSDLRNRFHAQAWFGTRFTYYRS